MASVFVLLDQSTYSNVHLTAVIVAGSFVLIALILSIFLILQHLKSYTKPEEQKWVIAVLFMVPIYACQSIISLCDPKLSLACDITRSCYEAFALYSFGSYLIACLGGEGCVVELLEIESRKLLTEPLLGERDESQKLRRSSICIFFRQPCLLGKNLLVMEKFGLVQYMILKILCALVAFLLGLFGMYGDGEFKWYYGYPYMAVVLNFSQMWALFCLVQFYNVTHERLKSIKPLAKFVSFKAIVFATWWQGVGIALLCSIDVLPNESKFQTGLQDFLICVEMAVAAVAHVFVFSARPYQFLPGKSTTERTEVRVNTGGEEKDAFLVEKRAQIEAPGTSVTESVKDIVVEGGQHVVKDVALTINQAIQPVEKGVAKIQEKFHKVTIDADVDDTKVEIEEFARNIN